MTRTTPTLRPLARLLPLMALALAIGLALGAQTATAAPTEQRDPPSTCQGDCRVALGEALAACARGDEQCIAAARAAHAECLKACGPAPREPREPSCAEDCQRKYREAMAACARGDEQCIAAARAAHAECLKACGPAPREPREPRGCEDGCAARAREMHQTCVGNGGDPADCRARAGKAYERCLLSCDPNRRPPPARCEEGCGTRARAMYQTCVENGGGEDACRARATQAYERCLKSCEPAPRRPRLPGPIQPPTLNR